MARTTHRSDVCRRSRRASSRLPFALGILASALPALLAPTDARAEPESDTFDLEWTAPEECPSHDQVVAEIDRLAPRRRGRAFHARVDVQHDLPHQYHAHVTLRAGSTFDERDVDGSTCAEIVDASALLVALALAPIPDRVARPAREKKKTPPATISSRSRDTQLHLGVAFGLETLALPRPAPILRPAAGISTGHLLVDLEGFVSASVGESLAAEPQKGASFRLFGTRLSGCWLFRAKHLRAGPCLAVGLLGIGTTSFGVRTRDTVTWTPTLGADARLVWTPVPHFAGLVEIVAGVPAEQLEFFVETPSGARALHHLEPMTLAVGFGIARLWDLF